MCMHKVMQDFDHQQSHCNYAPTSACSRPGIGLTGFEDSCGWQQNCPKLPSYVLHLTLPHFHFCRYCFFYCYFYYFFYLHFNAALLLPSTFLFRMPVPVPLSFPVTVPVPVPSPLPLPLPLLLFLLSFYLYFGANYQL